ncbi:FUSC family protein [Roseomonas sp. SSH11]|uniref:FUSC family protein n=1 Tax=Pararoseomonas baculiformis TaxID=2820812 RepID=A0ABS4AM48_9PROT|nr:FUSC family protein [Pararoseomonas baculiformis]MBP0447294.1 FUSC family protein [Pararoseomonas baculiformis]
MTPPDAHRTRPSPGSSALRRFLLRCLAAMRRDPARLTIQSVLAVLISYLAAQWLRLPEPSWAVFSALYVIQGSIGGTITAARDRVLGAVTGSLIALACIYLIGLGGWRTVLSLVAGVGSMSLIASLRPSYSYGLVTVAILIVAPGMELIENAILQVAAISLGATAGAAASVSVLPRQAHRGAEYHLAQALAGCSALLSACMARMLAQDAADIQAAHERIDRELAEADRMVRQTRLRRKEAHRVSLPRLKAQVERLWYTLAIADRLSTRPLPDAASARLAGPVRDATRQLEGLLCDISDALAGGKLPVLATDFRSPADQVARAVEELRVEGLLHAMPREEAEQVFGLSLTWQQLTQNLGDILDVTGSRSAGEAA